MAGMALHYDKPAKARVPLKVEDLVEVQAPGDDVADAGSRGEPTMPIAGRADRQAGLGQPWRRFDVSRARADDGDIITCPCCGETEGLA
jgi:hypothetical protein